jgi:hypothetical protein
VHYSPSIRGFFHTATSTALAPVVAAIECRERAKDPAGLAPKGCFIAAEAIEREIR